MKKLVGILLILLGIVLGIYLGIWIMFIGGIVQIVNAIKANPVNAWGITIGITKFIFSGFVGWLTFIGCSGIGIALLYDDN